MEPQQSHGSREKAPPNSVNQYMPQGAIGQLTLRNQLQEQTCYNALLQEVGMRIGTAGPSLNCASQGGDLLGLGFSYTLASPPPGGSATGSNLQSQTMTAPLSSGLGTLTLGQTYGYDTLNRINAVNEAVNGTANWYWNFAADQYGNLWSNGTNLSSNTTNMAQAQSYYSTATNRLTQYGSSSSPASVPNDGYDAAGNLTDLPESAGIGMGVMQYDGDNHMVQYQANSQSANITTYDYDGEGRRVRRTETGVVALTTVYVYDGAGNLAAEYDQGGTPPAGGMQYLTQDHLGSTRLVTDGNGAPVQRLDYLPFGDSIPSTVGSRSTVNGYGASAGLPLQFTGKERDAETGLDFFGARYFSGAQGRFTSPDAPFADQHPEDPQSWNMYAYVRNNPLKNTDPDGRDCQNGVVACGNYILGGAGAVFNAFTAGVVNAPAHILNAVISPFTSYQFPDAVQPLYTPANAEQNQGAQSANAVMLVAPVAEAGATALVDALGTGAKVEAGTTAVQTGVQANKAVGDAFRDEVNPWSETRS
jgi:RHS repeat-associated protein